MWRAIRGYVSGTVAFVLCPCHLVFTLPLSISATAGTAFGVWLEGNTAAFVAIVTVAFIGGVILTVRWLKQNSSSEVTGVGE